MPVLSVVIPIYNAEKYLKKCLSSVVGQTFTDFELILVNDGSTDSSSKICHSYADKDKRITVIDKENEGTVRTRAVGINAAKSEYVMFVDSDDWIPDNAIELLYNKALETDSDICIGKMMRVFSSRALYKIDINANLNTYLSKASTYSDEAVNNVITRSFLFCGCFPCGPCARIYRRSLFENSYDYIGNIKYIGDDQYWNIGLFMNAKKVSIIDATVYFYRQIVGGTSKYMPQYFNDVVAGYENKLKAAKVLYVNPSDAYSGIAYAQLDLLESCINNLFLSDIGEVEIKARIKQYLSSPTISEAMRYVKSENATEFMTAAIDNKLDLIYSRAVENAKKQKQRRMLMNLLRIF